MDCTCTNLPQQTKLIFILFLYLFILRTQPGVQKGVSFTLTFLHQTSTFTDSVETIYSYHTNFNIRIIRHTLLLSFLFRLRVKSDRLFLRPPPPPDFDKFALSLTTVKNRFLSILTLYKEIFLQSILGKVAFHPFICKENKWKQRL